MGISKRFGEWINAKRLHRSVARGGRLMIIYHVQCDSINRDCQILATGKTKQEAIDAFMEMYLDRDESSNGFKTWEEVDDWYSPWVRKIAVGKAYWEDQEEMPEEFAEFDKGMTND